MRRGCRTERRREGAGSRQTLGQAGPGPSRGAGGFHPPYGPARGRGRAGARVGCTHPTGPRGGGVARGRRWVSPTLRGCRGNGRGERRGGGRSGGLAAAGAAASVRAVSHLVPDLFPFLAPDEGTAAGDAGLARQVGLAAHPGHRRSSPGRRARIGVETADHGHAPKVAGAGGSARCEAQGRGAAGALRSSAVHPGGVRTGMRGASAPGCATGPGGSRGGTARDLSRGSR